MIYYKIRSKKNPELFRMSNGTWNKHGKVYDTLGKLRSLLTMSTNWSRECTEDWEIVEYEVSVKAVKEPHEVMDPEKLMKLLAKRR